MPARKTKVTPAIPAGLDPLIPREAAYAAMGISAMTANRRQHSDPSFPKARLIGPRALAYLQSDVQTWINTRPAGPSPPPVAALLAARVARDRTAAAHGD